MKPIVFITWLALTMVPVAVAAQNAIPVTTVPAALGAIEQTYSGQGRVQPLFQEIAAPQFDGRIVETFVQAGQQVAQGQALARLSPKSAELGTSSQVLGGATYTVVANIAGVITQQHKARGDVVVSGTPIYTIVPASGFRVRLDLPLAYGSDVSYSSPAVLHLPSGDLSVRPSGIEPFDLTGSGYFPVEFTVTERAPLIGSIVAADLVIKRHENALLVPRQALVERNGGFQVFTVAADKATQVPVTIGIETPDFVEILTGLKPGDQVITVGNFALDDGATVRVSTGG